MPNSLAMQHSAPGAIDLSLCSAEYMTLHPGLRSWLHTQTAQPERMLER